MGADADFAGEAVERRESERLGLSVGPVVGSGDVDGTDVVVAYALAQEVGAKVDVLTGVEAGRVAGLGKRALVVLQSVPVLGPRVVVCDTGKCVNGVGNVRASVASDPEQASAGRRAQRHCTCTASHCIASKTHPFICGLFSN